MSNQLECYEKMTLKLIEDSELISDLLVQLRKSVETQNSRKSDCVPLAINLCNNLETNSTLKNKLITRMSFIIHKIEKERY